MQEPGGGTGSNGGYEVIGFANSDLGWRQQFATGSNAPYTLELTDDAGVTWSLLPSVDAHGGCQEAPVVFADPSVAFAAPPLAYVYVYSFGVPTLLAPWVWRTTDGGDSWSEMTVATPSSLAGASAFYGQPQFFAGVGVLPVTFTKGSSTWVGFYRSADSGMSWDLASIVSTQSDLISGSVGGGCQSPTSVSGAFPVVAMAGPQTWWVIGTATGGRTASVTSNGGASWTSSAAGGIPPYTVSAQEYASQEGFISALQASSPTRAWMTVTEGASIESQAPVLIETLDGGRTWAPLVPSS